MKKGNILDNLEIEDMAFGGKGIARIKTEQGDYVVFVENTLPGQQVRARITKRDKRYAEAKLLRVLRGAKEEEAVPYQAIAGAPFVRFPIQLQAQYKERGTLEMMRRLGQLEAVERVYDGYIESPMTWHYRNKMEYSFSTLVSAVGTEDEWEGFALGFKRRGQWWAVENLDGDSGLFDAQWERGMPLVRAFCERSGLPAWSPRLHEGFYRYIVVRKSFEADRLLVSLVTSSAGIERFDKAGFVALVRELLGERCAGIQQVYNDDSGDAVKLIGSPTETLYGSDKIEETLLGLRFEISMQSFFQTNPRCAERLYERTMSYVQQGVVADSSRPIVMDLFCGTGTIAQLLSRCAGVEEVVGVDIVPEAIADAERNARRNGIEQIRFYAADVQRFLPEYPQYKDKIGTIVLDPPRAGISPKAMQYVIGLGAPRIVYVSCNPATQARDIVLLGGAGYRVKRLSLVDQFPHTSHVESVVLLERD